VAGGLTAIGTVSQKIVFDFVETTNIGMFSDQLGGDDTGNTYVNLDNVEIIGSPSNPNGNNVSFVFASSGFEGTFALRNSAITNMYRKNLLYSMSGSIVIERNVFDEVGLFHINGGSNSLDITFRNNRLVKKTDDQYNGEFFIGLGYLCNESVKIEYNSFLDDGFAVALLEENACLSALNNYWGTTDETVIATKIKDKNNDIGLKGEIPFKPFLTEPHPDTP
jgi:hypothetical protein